MDVPLQGDEAMNVLLQEWETPFGVPPFGQIADDDWGPAVDEALTRGRAEIAAIAGDPEAPTFANTIEALERAGTDLDRVLGAFYGVAGADSTPAREALQRDFAPKLSAYSSEITSNAALFARIEAVWEGRADLDLTDEQARVLMLTRRGFVRSGAQLTGAEAERLTAVKARLAVLGTEFTQNLLADERDWSMPLAEDDLVDLPDFVIDAARAAGEEAGVSGPVVTLSRSLIVPFLQFSPMRHLREKAYAAWTARGARGGATDNRGIAAETLRLRAERATLLGYDSFAAYKLETEMAGTADAVRDLLMQVWVPAKAAAEADAKVLERMLHQDGYDGRLEAWDWRYYSEKRRQEEHDLDEAALKPYLQLDRMIEAAFACATRLFGLDFAPLDAPTYHPDVRLWEVTRDGRHLAVFMGDYFARGSKRSGAWCTTMRDQSALDGEVRPLVLNVCNFARPPKGQPALLSYDDARTLFHEFGHALHQMLSDVTYRSISGTSVARDFVELPSQLYEHWLEVPEVLTEFATHATTGEAMPQAMLEKVLAAATYDTGFSTVEYIASALVDLEFHDGAAPADPMQKQAEVLERIGMPRAIGMRHGTPHFAHVFAGDGYSSGYYSYMWSEVMDADAFAAFEAEGDPFDAALAAKARGQYPVDRRQPGCRRGLCGVPRGDAGCDSTPQGAGAGGLVQHLVGAHTPYRLFGGPAAVAAGLDIAEREGAFRQACDHALLELGDADRGKVGAGADDQVLGVDDDGAVARDQRIVDPAPDPLAVDHAAPVAVFGDDLQRHAAAQEHPVDAMRQRRAAAHVALVGLERDKAWQRQIGFGADGRRGERRRHGGREDFGRHGGEVGHRLDGGGGGNRRQTFGYDQRIGPDLRAQLLGEGGHGQHRQDPDNRAATDERLHHSELPLLFSRGTAPLPA